MRVGRRVTSLSGSPRAQDAGLKIAVLPQVVLRRRLHDDNLGLRRQAAARREYLSVMKTILDRRRTATTP